MALVEEQAAIAPAKGVFGKRARTAMKTTFCVAIAIPVLFSLSNHLGQLQGAAIYAAIDAIHLSAILGSIFFTAISFAAIARYDEMGIRLLGLPVPKGTAIRNGFIATALSQGLGMGFLTGTFARWRLYRGYGVTAAQSAMISGIVIFGFITGFTAILATLVVVNPDGLAALMGSSAELVRGVALAIVGLTLATLVLTLIQPRLTLLGRRVKLPPFALFARQISLAGCDAIPAALAFWMLLPAETAPSALAIIPIYLTALGLGLLSNTPGGIGVLELTAIVALPFIPTEQLVAALIVHRLIYFIAPALVGASLLILREVTGASCRLERPVPLTEAAAIGHVPDAVAPILDRAVMAEANLAYLGDKDFILSECGTATLMVARSGNSLVALGDPIGPRSAWPGLITRHRLAARDRFLAPAFYRVSDGFAQLLQRDGMTLQQIGTEGVVPIANFTTVGASKRELRRKLRQAEKAGIEITCHAPGTAPLEDYADLAAAWSDAKSGARGFSMGRFDLNYLARFPIFEARVDGVPVALLSVWVSGEGCAWSIDVMCHADTAPDGTMHALVVHAIEAARGASAHSFSLCSVPFGGIEGDGVFERLASWVYAKRPEWHGGQGLYRFKNAFRPDWQPRFAASENYMTFALAAVDTKRLVTAPA